MSRSSPCGRSQRVREQQLPGRQVHPDLGAEPAAVGRRYIDADVVFAQQLDQPLPLTPLITCSRS